MRSTGPLSNQPPITKSRQAEPETPRQIQCTDHPIQTQRTDRPIQTQRTDRPIQTQPSQLSSRPASRQTLCPFNQQPMRPSNRQRVGKPRSPSRQSMSSASSDSDGDQSSSHVVLMNESG